MPCMRKTQKISDIVASSAQAIQPCLQIVVARVSAACTRAWAGAWACTRANRLWLCDFALPNGALLYIRRSLAQLLTVSYAAPGLNEGIRRRPTD
jgi:hypothetical protein